MINNNYLYKNFNKSNDFINYLCPSCGNECNEKSIKCSVCGFNLNDYKSIILSKLYYFNETLNFINKGDYFNAIILISKFLALEPFNQKAYELYIFLLYKNNKIDDYKKELEIFESKFKYSTFIQFVELEGIENYSIPLAIDLNFDVDLDSFNSLLKLYINNKNKYIKEIVDLEDVLFSIVHYYKDKKDSGKLMEFYDKKFLQFLSKFEISISESDGKNFDLLDDKEKMLIDVLGIEKKFKKKNGTIITISPGVFVRSKLIIKEKVLVVRK